MKYIVIVS